MCITAQHSAESFASLFALFWYYYYFFTIIIIIKSKKRATNTDFGTLMKVSLSSFSVSTGGSEAAAAATHNRAMSCRMFVLVLVLQSRLYLFQCGYCQKVKWKSTISRTCVSCASGFCLFRFFFAASTAATFGPKMHTRTHHRTECWEMERRNR